MYTIYQEIDLVLNSKFDTLYRLNSINPESILVWKNSLQKIKKKCYPYLFLLVEKGKKKTYKKFKIILEFGPSQRRELVIDIECPRLLFFNRITQGGIFVAGCDD